MSFKFTGELCVMKNEESCKTGKWIDSSFQNWHEDFDKFWPNHLKISNICTLMDYLWPRYIMFELKKYRGDMFDGTEYWCKIWRKTDLYFQNWHEKFGKFSPEHLKVSKFGHWWDSFIQSWKCMRLKFAGEVFVMTMKKDAKLEEELTCPFKIDMRTLLSFDPSTQNSPNFALY